MAKSVDLEKRLLELTEEVKKLREEISRLPKQVTWVPIMWPQPYLPPQPFWSYPGITWTSGDTTT